MAIIYRQAGASPCYDNELAEHREGEGYDSPRFSAIVVPLAADGSLNTIEDGYIRYWSREWKNKVSAFAEKNRDNLAGAKGMYVQHFGYSRGLGCHSVCIVGIPVQPLKSGVLQYAWLEAGLKTLRNDCQSGRRGWTELALADVIRPEDKGIRWSVVKGIIEEVFGDWSGKLYVYPPLQEDGEEDEESDSAPF